jgi:hypothetical protein
MRWVLAATVAALLTGCGAGNADRSQRPSSPGTSSQHFTPQAIEPRTSCPRPRTTLTFGHRQLTVPPSGRGHPRITMLVGTKVLVRTSGICAGAVEDSPQNARLRVLTERHGSHVRVTSLEAVHPGVVRLIMSLPMCARPARLPQPQCRGGIRTLGTAVMTVKASGLPS